MKKTLILIVAALISMGAVAQTKKAKKSKKVDPITALYQKQKAEFEAANAEVTKQMNEIMIAYRAVKSREEQDSISKLAMPIYQKYMAAQKEYQEKNPSTILAASFIAPYVSRMSLEEAKKAYGQFCEEAKQSQWGKEMMDEITARENTQPGKPAPMIAKNDIDGNPFSLADLKGKVVLLDFWASWCVPCRKSNPHMMRIYDKYRKHGLEFVYVGDNDSRPQDLRQAIEQDGVGREGIHHVLRGLKEIKDENGVRGFDRSEDVSDLYAVHEIPTKFLIGKDGNIIGKVESDQWLDEQLSQIFLGKPNRDFHIEGTMTEGGEGENISLYYTKADGTRGVEKAIVKDGKFEFSGTMADAVENAVLQMGDERSQLYTRIYLEPSETQIVAKADDFKNLKYSGSSTQMEYDSFYATVKDAYDAITDLDKQYSEEKDADKRQALHEAMGENSDKIKKAELEYLKAHPASSLTPGFLYSNMSSMPFSELKAAYEAMPEKSRNSSEGKLIKEEIDTQARVQPGQPAYMIKKEDVMTGKMFDMEKLRGKYIIVDFWASWCVPCRKSNPHMIELYNKYHKKGLEMVFVGDNDSNADVLREAIKKDGLQKMHHVLRGLKIIDRKTYQMDKTNDISDKYGIHYLPTKFLIDKDGNIIGKFDSEELDAKLAEIFGK